MSFFVDGCFERAEKRRRVLDLIDENRRGVSRKEQRRRRLGLLCQAREVEADVGVMWKDFP
jgi:hypothetical protein